MSADVPPDQQCTMPGCDERATTDDVRGGLSPEHAPDEDATGETETESTDTEGRSRGVNLQGATDGLWSKAGFDAPDVRADGGTHVERTTTETTTGEFGVLPEDGYATERVAHERGAYLAATTDLSKREGRALAYSELGFTDTAAAREIGVAPATVSGWLDRAAAQYGLSATYPKVEADRGDFSEVTPADVLDYSPGARETYREYAVENAGVVPVDVLAALSEGGDR